MMVNGSHILSATLQLGYDKQAPRNADEERIRNRKSEVSTQRPRLLLRMVRDANEAQFEQAHHTVTGQGRRLLRRVCPNTLEREVKSVRVARVHDFVDRLNPAESIQEFGRGHRISSHIVYHNTDQHVRIS